MSAPTTARATTPAEDRSQVLGEFRDIRSRGRWRFRLALLGPAFVVAVAYVDPGNVATNVEAGARTGYMLVWVVVLANVMALLVQYLSAKLGLATGRNLPEQCRELAPRWLSRLLWAQAELVAMATDLAEFAGAAVGLSLLFGMPIPLAAVVTAVVSFAVLACQQRGCRAFELAIMALLLLVLAGFAYDLLTVGRQSPADAMAGLVPHLSGGTTALLAAAIIGATVMPHAVYLHSALTQHRVRTDRPGDRRLLLRYLRIDCTLGFTLAGAVNLGMLCLSAALFRHTESGDLDAITAAHDDLGRTVGGGAAMAFAVALLASGISSASVGTYAGQVVMRGFLRRRIPLFARRTLTMAPALLILCAGLPVTATLVLSQVVLAFGIPFALAPLVVITRRRDLMGPLANRPATTAAGALVCALVICLNAYLVVTMVQGG
ncbi:MULTISPECIES: Nramp family divalent metal transporter [Streptomyces]|uniref:Nramp family divalent metal transporter n=1 Tax=Streptomyces malaysiensis TaxID=92644 RepID=A0ABX6VZV7_STRMQ|nr:MULTISPECIES: Nramp family divalent metal transporter [Streptomyces]MCQ6246605.1 Nramp family divalent metal transporter [Streptomyces malaysiensis]QPI53796.1 Nramp family divalent metal transporter [Streptomyces solisilvae]WHX23676.1 Nramp family divalent metal transporter [Streptomyces sp. NA07423]